MGANILYTQIIENYLNNSIFTNTSNNQNFDYIKTLKKFLSNSKSILLGSSQENLNVTIPDNLNELNVQIKVNESSIQINETKPIVASITRDEIITEQDYLKNISVSLQANSPSKNATQVETTISLKGLIKLSTTIFENSRSIIFGQNFTEVEEKVFIYLKKNINIYLIMSIIRRQNYFLSKLVMKS